MAGEIVNIKLCSPFKLNSGLTGKYHAICHYSYHLPLVSPNTRDIDFGVNIWGNA